MGNAHGGEFLYSVFPHVQDVVPDAKARERIYSVIVFELENMDCDTLGEVVDCYTGEVDPVLLRVLEQRGHIGDPDDWTEEDWDAATAEPYYPPTPPRHDEGIV